LSSPRKIPRPAKKLQRRTPGLVINAGIAYQ
jgi:hypothetical protein